MWSVRYPAQGGGWSLDLHGPPTRRPDPHCRYSITFDAASKYGVHCFFFLSPFLLSEVRPVFCWLSACTYLYMTIALRGVHRVWGNWDLAIIGRGCGCFLKGPNLIMGAGSHGKRMGAGLSLSPPTPWHFLVLFFSSCTAISEKITKTKDHDFHYVKLVIPRAVRKAARGRPDYKKKKTEHGWARARLRGGLRLC